MTDQIHSYCGKCCAHCRWESGRCVKVGVKLESSRTAYHDEDITVLVGLNAPVMLCREHAACHHAH